MDKLSRERPLGNIFNLYVLLSVLAQFALHIASLVYITNLSHSIDPCVGSSLPFCFNDVEIQSSLSPGVIDLEAKFEPSLLNTAIYLLGLSQQVSTFTINFQVSNNLFPRLCRRLTISRICQGRPFREGIRENSTLYWGLVGASAVAFSGATDFMPEMNRWLQIVEMDNSVRHLHLYPLHHLH